MNYSLDNVFNGHLPIRVVYGFIRHDAYNGHYHLNPFNFQHVDLRQTAVYINGQCLPMVPFTPDYTNRKNWVREYKNLFKTAGIGYSNAGLDVTREEFPEGYCLYAYDLTPNRAAADLTHLAAKEEGNVRIDFQFGSALQHAMSCIIFAEYEKVIGIDAQTNIKVYYSPIQ